ncbi:unnamed protein product [Schistocephalus solidus]|uniref:Uncharacterized protein n=1 Tax=Schistocephalus solidus TaxID=70667 RepID=A0A3P7F139_SCHSO|nr:unnamed protein product [Schistocephalus solidus]
MLEVNTAALSKLDKCKALEAELQTSLSHLLDEIRSQCVARDWSVPDLTMMDKASEGVAVLHQEWRRISEEAESALQATTDQLAECEAASAAFTQALTWLRTQSTRLKTRPRLSTAVVSQFTKLQLSLRPRLTKTARDYSPELEFLESLIASQSDLYDWWKKFNEEIASGRAEVDAAFRLIEKVLQLDASAKRAEAELFTLISTTENSLIANQTSLECMRDFTAQLNAWNDWLAASTQISPSLLILIGTYSAPEVLLETGDGLVRSLSAAATRLSEAVRPTDDLTLPVIAGSQPTQDNFPATLASTLACDLVRHLSGTWQQVKSDLPQLRAQKVSNAATVQAFCSRLDELTNWVIENRRTLQEDLKPYFACRSIDCSFEELVGQFGQPVRDAMDRFADYSTRTSEYCSQVISLLQKLELRKNDFDSLREEAIRLSRLETLDPSSILAKPSDADSLLTDYTTLLADTRALVSASERRMTSQRELTQQWTTLRAQCANLQELLANCCNLTGDRHALLVRLDHLNVRPHSASHIFTLPWFSTVSAS